MTIDEKVLVVRLILTLPLIVLGGIGILAVRAANKALRQARKPKYTFPVASALPR